MLIQYGVVPLKAGEDGSPRILLVTSRETRRWVLPRGNPVPGLSPAESAAQEAFEEAGILGELGSEPLGTYRYGKRKRSGALIPAEVHLFRLDVREELADWPERGQRERRWFEVHAAAAAVDEPELQALIRSLARGPA